MQNSRGYRTTKNGIPVYVHAQQHTNETFSPFLLCIFPSFLLLLSLSLLPHPLSLCYPPVLPSYLCPTLPLYSLLYSSLCPPVHLYPPPHQVPPTAEEVGHCDTIEVQEIGDTNVILFAQKSGDSRIATIVVSTLPAITSR